MAGTYTCLNYHLVFSTKHREPFIDDPDFEERLHKYIGSAVRNQGGVPYLINGTEDHIHALIRYIADAKISSLLREIKSQSSKWVHDTFPTRQRFAWQEGYGAFSVSASQIPVVKGYVAGQKEHHQSCEFKSEFRGLLRAHEIEWDEEKIWL